MDGGGHDLEDCRSESMVVVVMLPPSDCQFHFGVVVEVDLLQFGSSVVLSGVETCFCGPKVPLCWAEGGSPREKIGSKLELDVHSVGCMDPGIMVGLGGATEGGAQSSDGERLGV